MSDGPIGIVQILEAQLQNQFKYPVNVYADPEHVRIIIFFSETEQPEITYDTEGFNITPEFVAQLKQYINQVIANHDQVAPVS